MKRYLPFLIVLISFFDAKSQVVASWNFNNIVPGDISTATPNVGTGSIILVGNITTPTTGSAGSINDTGSPNLALQTTDYPAQSTANKSSGIQVMVNTTGFTDLLVKADIRLSNTSSRWVQLQYTIDGNNFIDFGEPTRLGEPGDNNAGDTWHKYTADLSSISLVNNNQNFGFRLVSAFAPVAFLMHNNSTTYPPNEAYESARNTSLTPNSNYAGGTWRFDLISIEQKTGLNISSNVGEANFSQLIGSPSTNRLFVVSGSGLENNINITTASPFEISLSPDSDFGTSVALTPENGIVGETPFYVRLNSNELGSFSERLTITNNGNIFYDVALIGVVQNLQISFAQGHRLELGDYTFTSWSPNNPFGTYPPNMKIWTHAVTDPTLNTTYVADYNCRYNLTARSRFVGEGENGISMVNTGNSQFTGICDGTDTLQVSGDVDPNGRAGAIILSLNSTNTKNIDVAWTGRTIFKNSRVYNLTLQYKIGDPTQANENWQNIDQNATYTSGEDNESLALVTRLPEECNDKEFLYLRWVYNYVSGTGARAQLGLDDITVKGDKLNSVSNFKLDKSDYFPNPVRKGETLIMPQSETGVIKTLDGVTITTFQNTQTVPIDHILPGMYIIQIGKKTGKLIVIE